MKWLKRKEIDEKLNKKIGLKRTGWLANEFQNSFEADYIYELSSSNCEEILDYIKKFLEKQNMEGIIFFPDTSTGWETYSGEKGSSPVNFETVEETMEFLKKEIFWGAENYYVADKNLSWILTICHEGDLHVSGSKGFVKEFKKRYL